MPNKIDGGRIEIVTPNSESKDSLQNAAIEAAAGKPSDRDEARAIATSAMLDRLNGTA